MDVLDLAVRARRLRRALHEPDGHAALERGRDDADGVHQPRGDVGVQRVPVDPAVEAARQRRRDRAATPRAAPAARAPRPPAAAARAPVPMPITGEITLPLRTERQWSRKRRRLLAGGQRRDRRDDRGVDPADARPAHDLDPLAARREGRDAAPTARPPRRRRAHRRRGARARSAHGDQRGASRGAAHWTAGQDLARARYGQTGQRGLAARVQREQAVDAAEAEDRRRLAVASTSATARRGRAPARRGGQQRRQARRSR